MKTQRYPSSKDFKQELARTRQSREFGRTLRGTIYILLIVAAVSVLVATLFLPVLQVTGTSMEPTLQNGQIVVASKNGEFAPGDIVAFYYNNKILLKRVIGTAGDQISIDPDGNVSVNGELLDEPYLAEKSLGTCDLEFPYQVPDNRIFVLGDHRATSIDSRSNSVGCIADEYIVGKVLFRVWPFSQFGTLQ